MTKSIIVIGAGVGGLTTAALLAQNGYQVTVLEAQTVPGGSASTFFHKGYRFEAGATVAGGFQPYGPHKVAGDILGIDWKVHQHDPAWVVHLPDCSMALTSDNQDVLNAFPESESFWNEQSKIADLAWRMSAAGLPWFPTDIPEFLQLAKVGLSHFPSDLRLIPFAFSSVKQWASRHGLGDNKAFIRFLDATLLISAQNPSDRVNSIYGATAMDLARQGVYHVEGGIGGISEQLVEKLCEIGGDIQYRTHVKRIVIENGRTTGVMVQRGRRSTKQEFIPADFVVANTTPWSLQNLFAGDTPNRLQNEVANRTDTQGAFVLHLGIRDNVISDDIPDHHQIIQSYDKPMGEGETLYISMSPTWDKTRAPEGMRAVTVSTHTKIQQWWDLINEDEQKYQDRKHAFAEEMINTIDKTIPNFKSAVELCLPGTPITYQFYTLRHKGMVGGFPQTTLFNVRTPRTGISNVRLVGDSVFPGQSTAGVTLGAMRVAKDVMRHL